MTASAALKKVQIARKELRLDDETYRSVLERLTGHRSAADCNDDQLKVVLEEFKAKGWTPRVVAGGQKARKPASRKARPADHPSAKKARALWLSLWNLGEVRDPSEAALEAMARRQLKVEQLQWADQAMVYKLIEALKAMAERAGWSQDTSGYPKGTDLVKVLKLNLIRVQGARLGFIRSVVEYYSWSHAELDGVIRDQGVRIRALPEAAG